MYGLSYGGLLLDLFIVPALLWKPTRTPAVAAAAVFHSANTFLFPIDVFPALALAATLLFYPAHWPRRVLTRLRFMLGPEKQRRKEEKTNPDRPVSRGRA